MSENLQQVFIDFVKKAKDQLASVDAKYPSDEKEECPKYIEKLEIYQVFTERLIDEGARHLRVINHLNEELSKPDLDGTSTISSITLAEEKIFEDFEFLQKCLDKRVNLDEEAMNSLLHLQTLVESLFGDKQKLVDENNKLKEQNASCEIASKTILTLTKENEELKEFIHRNEETMKLVPNESCDDTPDTTTVNNELNDCLKNLEELRRQLNEKDKVISHLTNKLSHSSSSESKESTATQIDKPSRPKKHHQRSRSDASKSSSRSLTDNEKSDNEKLQLFKDAYKELARILKEKYEQLREYRHKIAELMKRLEECEKKDEELLELKGLTTNLKAKNNELIEHVSKLQEDSKLIPELKQQSDNLTAEIEKMRERETYLARKLTMQGTHIDDFRDERHNLIKINNEMMNSIVVCKKELAKFNVKYD